MYVCVRQGEGYYHADEARLRGLGVSVWSVEKKCLKFFLFKHPCWASRVRNKSVWFEFSSVCGIDETCIFLVELIRVF